MIIKNFIYDFNKYINEVFCVYYGHNICLEAYQIPRGICLKEYTWRWEDKKKKNEICKVNRNTNEHFKYKVRTLIRKNNFTGQWPPNFLTRHSPVKKKSNPSNTLIHTIVYKSNTCSTTYIIKRTSVLEFLHEMLQNNFCALRSNGRRYCRLK